MATWVRRGVPLVADGLLALVASIGFFAFSAAVVADVLPDIAALLLGVVYAILVLAVARFWGIAYAVPIGVASVVALDWYSIPPIHRPGFPENPDLAALAAYLVTGVLLGQLAAHARRQAAATEAARSVLADEQAALRRVATLVAREAPPAEVFATVTEEVQRLLGADVTSMLRFETDATVTVVARHGVPDARVPLGTRLQLDGEDVPAAVFGTHLPAQVEITGTGPLAELLRELGFRSSAGCPIVVDGRVWGVMVAASLNSEPLPAGTESRIGEFTELVATAISNAETRTQLTASRARLVATGDEVRRRLERDLHDGAQQRLVSLALDLSAAETMAPREPSELRTHLARIRAELTEVLDELREMSRGIHPAILTDGGLWPALKALGRRSPVPVELDLRGDSLLPSPVEVALYYVVSEALTNAAKHAQASAVQVVIGIEDGMARLCIRDDGIGGANPDLGSGLIGLRDRVEAAGGKILVSSPPGHGTTLEVTVPFEAGPRT